MRFECSFAVADGGVDMLVMCCVCNLVLTTSGRRRLALVWGDDNRSTRKLSGMGLVTRYHLPKGKMEAQVTTPAIPPHSSTDIHSGLSLSLWAEEVEDSVRLLNS